IAQAKTPFIDSLFHQYPNAQLLTDGLHVGLPDGQMGNSEVGHINLGAGRIIYQELAKINLAVKHHTLEKEAALVQAFAYAKKMNVNTHFIGLVSDGGVHSHINHLKGLIDASQKAGVENVFVHAFTDARDVDRHSGKKFIADLENYIQNSNAQLATVIGRYYAMDRDKRWERTKKAYDLLVKGVGTFSTNATESIQKSYDIHLTDEFIEPIVMAKNG